MELKIINANGGVVALCDHTELANFFERTKNAYADLRVSPEDQSTLKELLAAEDASRLKLTGIEFNGIMCSATGDDQAGLSALLLKHTVLKLSGQKMPDVHFRFENGNILTINADNIEELDAIWTPFRMSFFPPQQ